MISAFLCLGFILSFAVNVIMVISWMSEIAKKEMRKRNAHAFFGGNNVCVYLPLRIRQDDDKRSLISSEVFYSGILLSQFFKINGISFQFIGITSSDKIVPHENSLFIGGPKVIKCTYEKLSYDPHFKFINDEDSWTIKDLDSNVEFGSPNGDASKNKKYFAYLNKFKQQDKTIIIVAGINSFGTLGGITYITQNASIRKISKKHANKNISGIISSQIDSEKMVVTSSEIYTNLKEY